MYVKKRIIAVALIILMILGLIPYAGINAAEAADIYDDSFAMVLSDASGGSNRYLTTAGSNAFNVIMYNSTFSGVFGDQHMSGIELFLHGYRIATNGDIHYLPTPEQWDATPAPSRGTKIIDEATNTITVPMTFSGAPDGTLRYNIIASPEPEGGGVTLSVQLTSDMPASLAGKARFNLEFIPSRYESKSFQADSTGSGDYDTFGIFPRHPQSTMVETERPDLPTQAWYVKEWNEDRGESQPVPFAKGYGFSFAPEDDLYNISITSDSGELELFDGRDRAQNGWYVLSGLIPGGKSGDVVAQWHIRPKVIQNWVREPNIAFSQAGYAPNQEKFAVIELDKYDNDYPTTASLLHVNADGSREVAYTADVTAPVAWQRFKYVNFDFTDINQTGMYVIRYGDQETEIFPIADDVYDKSWQSALSGFLAVQMDHIEVRDGNRVWHGASHMDDASIGPLGVSWFDGQSMPANMPASIAERGIEPEEYIAGLNVGGWFDAGDFDLQGARETEVLQDLIFAAEAFDNMYGYDSLSVEWDDKTGGVVEMHKPDGIPDIVQQIAHGIKYILAQYDVLGGYGGTMELRRLRQYTHLGDPSSDTDGYIYDPSLSEGQIVERDGLVYSGSPDDRVLLLGGGGGSFTSTLTGTTSADIAGAAYVLKDYYPELAEKCFYTALEIWDRERASASPSLSTEWNTLVQLILAADKFGDSRVYEFKDRLSTLVPSAFAISSSWFGTQYGIASRYNALFIMDLMDDEFRTTVRNAVLEYAASSQVNYSLESYPFGVQWTTGSGWGGSPTIIGYGQGLGIMYKFFPDIPELKKYTLRAANYILGRHPVSNHSWLSGVGTKSHLHPYNSNRADESFIPGSILPGHITVSPDIVESLDDFNFLWFENESIINYQSKWISVGMAASLMAKDPIPEVQAPTKDFANDFMMSVKKAGDDDGYLQIPGFELYMYNNTFDTELGDRKNAGIELIQSGRRIATNGDISLLNAPEQWDNLIPPVLDSRNIDDVNNSLSASLTIPADSKGSPAVGYSLKAEPEPGGVKLTVSLDAPLPADLAGKAGFSLQFAPASFISKSYQADADGDGNYDAFGVFPLVPQNDMESAARARTEDQPWYVKNWYKDEGNKQPLPLATGKEMTFSAEDDETRIRITSDSGDLALYDGRGNTQDGWFILRTMIPAGATEVVWHISPDVNENWVRKPNVAYNQAGYAPDLPKTAVIELDQGYDAPAEAYIDRLNADGTYTQVFSGEIGEAVQWARYVYRAFDFSSVKEPGVYVIRYGGERSDPFPIAQNVYERTWQASLSGFLAVHMDHMKVREGYRIWHNQTFADDALQAPLNTQWFDGWSMGETSDSPYEPFEHIPGLAAGGWFDPSDNDLETSDNIEAIQALALAIDEFGIDYDTIMVDTDASFVEMHRADGKNDVQQQVKHGILQILGQIDNVGFVFKGLKVPSLKQYSQSGDVAKVSDGLIYDSALAASGETVSFGDSSADSSNAVYGLKSGKLDDRFAFVGTKDAALQLDAAAALASAAYVLKGFDDDLAARCLEAAESIWESEAIPEDGAQDTALTAAGWKAAVQLIIATNGGNEKYMEFLKDTASAVLSAENFGTVGWEAVRVLGYMDQDFINLFIEALKAYIPVLDSQISASPFGVPLAGGNEGVLEMGTAMSVLHEYFPGIVSSKYTLNALNYILGTHMYNNISWVSGVGTRSAELGYGSNRADRFYIAGGVVAGFDEVLPDFYEAAGDYAFLRDQTGYSINTAAKWIVLGSAADAAASESSYVPVTGVSVDKSTLSLSEGSDGQLLVTVEPADATDRTIVFTSTAPEVAKVESAVYDPASGKTTAAVRAISAGTAIIRAASVSNAESYAECTVTVTPAAVKTVLGGSESVRPGSSFTVTISLDGAEQDTYAEDITLAYDSDIFEYVGAEGTDSKIHLIKEVKGTAGRVRLIAANIGGVSGESSPALNISFRVRDGVRNASGNIAVAAARLGIAPEGTVIQAGLTSMTVNVTTAQETDKTKLIAAINNAEAIYVNAEVGSQPGQYPQTAKDNFRKAIDAAIAVRDDADAAQEEIDSAVVSLNDAIHDFRASVISSPGVSKQALSEAIGIADKLFREAVVGTEPGQYPQKAKDDLGIAIDAARSVYYDPYATQSQVNSAATALNIAIDTFRAAVNKEASADINGDGKINVGDLAVVAFYYGKDPTAADWDEAKKADVNGDEKIDIYDLAYVALKILE
jgi:endoglucanase